MSKPDELFEGLPALVGPAAPPVEAAAPRLRTAQRDQIELQVVDLESLLASDHPARAVWAYVEQLDLSEPLGAIRARGDEPGRPAADPKILMALWLYATIEGVGSARALARLCEAHVAYRWICGGVSMNHHTLSDFRVDRVALLDRLLAQGVAALVSEGLVRLERLAQDGVRIRASAGASSFRRRPRLELLLEEAEQRVATLKAELTADPAASATRHRAAQARAARERVEKVSVALERMKELEAQPVDRRETEHHHQKLPGLYPSRNQTWTAENPQGRQAYLPFHGWDVWQL